MNCVHIKSKAGVGLKKYVSSKKGTQIGLIYFQNNCFIKNGTITDRREVRDMIKCLCHPEQGDR